ncbi:MAG: enoyl-CoA hydratase/isomerase family protein [Firmicutes bacterium]|nr:enoyl-CoA hydratase/isomerase family protein [Bacillota bacterium]
MNQKQKYEDIILTKENKIATITINRPHERNAFTESSTFCEIQSAIIDCGADDNVSVIIITGAGEHFSAGGNIKSFKKLIDNETYLTEKLILLAGNTSEIIRRCPKPIIAAINGVAYGAAFALACACDFRIMTDSSRLSMAFINMGLPGDTGAFYYLERLVGLGRATELMMTGDPIDGKRAYEIGLCTSIAKEGELMKTAYEFAQKIAQRPLFAISRQKDIVNEFFLNDIRRFTQAEVASMMESSRHPDFKEAVYAFLEKRSPEFNKK